MLRDLAVEEVVFFQDYLSINSFLKIFSHLRPLFFGATAVTTAVATIITGF